MGNLTWAFQSRKYYYTLITSYYTRHHFNFLFTVNTFIIMRLSTFIYTSLVVISITCSTCYAMESRSCPVLQKMKTINMDKNPEPDTGSDLLRTVRDYKLCMQDRKQKYEAAVQDELEKLKDELSKYDSWTNQIFEKQIRKKHAYIILYGEEISIREQEFNNLNEREIIAEHSR